MSEEFGKIIKGKKKPGGIDGIEEFLVLDKDGISYVVTTQDIVGLETDPIFIASPAFSITNTDIGNWNTAFGWGDPSGLYTPISHISDIDNPHSTSWSNLLGIPSTFPPSPHTHVEADITDLDKYTQAEVNSLIFWDRVGTTIEPKTANDNLDIGTGDFSGKELNIRGIKLDTTTAPVLTPKGTIWWNGEEYTINIETGLGATIQVGQEVMLLYYNDTGGQIDNFTTLHPKSATVVGSLVVPTPEKADASKWELCEGTLSIATHNIPNGQLGLATRFGKARGGNSTGWSPGSQLWLSTDGSGLPTVTKPVFPNYSISLGGSLQEHATEGEIFVTVTKAVGDTFNDAWDGSIRETFDFLVTSTGTVVTGTLTNINPANNLTLFFSDGAVFYTLDTTSAPLTIVLTPGTDSSTITNYVYIPISTKVLTVSTSGFPATEHVRIAQLEVQSAATVLAELGAERNQNINDHLKKENDNGHILHIAERIRQLNAEHDNGTEGSLTGTSTNGYIQVTSGGVWQMHNQTFSSFSMPTRNIMISNDFTTGNRRTNNLNTINAYSDGSSWNNQWGKVVIWGIANKTGEPDFVKLNLPSDGYNSEANAIGDSLNYADYTIPKKYKGVGFLIAAFTVRISGGTITYNAGTAYQDLRGFVPNNIAGGGGGSGITSYLGLVDTPSTNVGQAGKFPKVNSGETAHEYSQMTENANGSIQIEGQATGGHSVESFSATKTFDLDNGNALEMPVTANITSLSLSNKVNGGSHLIYLVQDGTGGHTIPTPDSSWGKELPNSDAFLTGANDVNMINVNISPSGVVTYTNLAYTP